MTIKRLNYFQGQFLKVSDFKDEQRYHMDMLKLHNKSMHTWGIAKGLTVTSVDRRIIISEGLAIDPTGTPLVLAKNESIEPASFPGNFFYIVIRYSEQETDSVDETGVRGNTRIVEFPQVDMPASADNTRELILAQVTIPEEEGDIQIDVSDRRYSGITFFTDKDAPPTMTGKIFDNDEFGIYVESPWTEFGGRVRAKSLKITGATILGESGDDDSIVINGVIHPRRPSNSKLPANRLVGRKLQVTGDIEFQQILSTPDDMIISADGRDISLLCQRGVFIKKEQKKDGKSLSGNLVVEGDLTVSGRIISRTSKQFVISHPTDQNGKYLIHSTLEGPETAVFYRGEAQLSKGKIEIDLPEYFEALTEKEQRTVLITPQIDGDAAISNLAASKVENGKFTVKAIDKHNLSQKFYWEVKAVRSDVAPIEVEKTKTEVEDQSFPLAESV